MKHESQEAPVYQVFTFLAEIFFFATMMPVCQVFITGTFYVFQFFCIFEFFQFFLYYQGAYLLGFHQDNDFFMTFSNF